MLSFLGHMTSTKCQKPRYGSYMTHSTKKGYCRIRGVPPTLIYILPDQRSPSDSDPAIYRFIRIPRSRTPPRATTRTSVRSRINRTIDTYTNLTYRYVCVCVCVCACTVYPVDGPEGSSSVGADARV